MKQLALPPAPGLAYFPGVDADGYGTHDVQLAVGQEPRAGLRAKPLWDPYVGFLAPVRPTPKRSRK